MDHQEKIASTLRDARLSAALSLRKLARRAGTSHATLLAYERARKVPSTATFLRIIEACGFAIDLDLEPRIRERDGISRGEELEAVLHLAEQFPQRMSRHMNLPRFGTRG